MEGSEICPNCGAQLQGNYCSSCGQKNQPLRQPIWHFIRDAIAEYFGIDGRFWRTLSKLSFSPGQLTIDYVEGRRIKYLRPLRIYLITTVAFFFLLSVVDPVQNIENAVTSGAGSQADTTATVDSRLDTIEIRLRDDKTRLAGQIAFTDSLQAVYDSLEFAFRSDSASAALPDSLVEDRQDRLDDAKDDWEDEVRDLDRLRESISLREQRFLWQRSFLSALPPDSVIKPAEYHNAAVRLYPDANAGTNINLPEWFPESTAIRRIRAARTDAEKRSAFSDFGRGVIEKLPIAIFIMLPIFALLMKIIFLRRNWFYTEHLVFGLHSHAFAFLIFSLMAVTTGVSDGAMWSDQLSLVLMLILYLYFLVAMKRVYKQGWIKTIFKSLLLGTVYNFVMLIGIIVALILAAAID
ncbi:MAG: DUF3667 domain-containing protein [Rhodothermales bacterium]|nr:DUF3667 domain-containing protein [Rhodothermales bacterium]